MRCAAAFLLCVVALGTAGAQRQLGADHWLRQRLEPVIRPGITLVQAQARMREHFDNSDLDGRGISRASHDLALRLQQTQTRAAKLETLLALDLNGDGVITSEEMETSARAAAARGAAELPRSDRQGPLAQQAYDKPLAANVERWLKHDRDRDDRLTINEMIAGAEAARQDEEAAEVTANRQPPRRAQLVARLVPLALDGDNDGVVSLTEYEAAVAAIFAEYDDDGDGAISAAEALRHRNRASTLRRDALAAIAAQEKLEALRARVARCALTKPPETARLILISTLHGIGLSTVGIGGDDDLVEVADIVIEPGPEPLALALSSPSAIIWRLSGAVDRVAGVVVASENGRRPGGPARSGIVGIPRDKVSIAGATDCIPAFFQRNDGLAQVAAAAVESLLGRTPDNVIGLNAAGTLRLPSGINDRNALLTPAMELSRREATAILHENLRRYHRAGLIALDPSLIISGAAAAPYPILPLDAGLAQLVDSGALTITAYTDGVLMSPGERAQVYRDPSQFLVERPLRLPAGLQDRRLVFALAAHVPIPTGDLGQNCVLDADGKPVANPRNCPGVPR